MANVNGGQKDSNRSPLACLATQMAEKLGSGGQGPVWLAVTGGASASVFLFGTSAELAKRHLPPYELKARTVGGFDAQEIKLGVASKLISAALFKERKNVEVYSLDSSGKEYR